MTEKRKYDGLKVIEAIEALSFEINPFYLTHSDFIGAKNDFQVKVFNDFEDLMILHSAVRAKSELFVTNDKELLALGSFEEMKIVDC